MGITWITVALAVLLLAAVAPWVQHVRHPAQRPFAAYLVFVSVFALTWCCSYCSAGWRERSAWGRPSVAGA